MKFKERLKSPRHWIVFIGIILLYVFANPSLGWFISGVIVVLLGEALRIWGAGHLVKTEEMITSGPYAYVRHPLYLGTTLILIGFCMMARTWVLLIIGLLAFIFEYLPRKNKIETQRLIDKYGQEYEKYASSVRPYLPHLRPYSGRKNARWSLKKVVKNSEHKTLIAIIIGIILMIIIGF